MKKNSYETAIVILNWNGGNMTRECVSTIKKYVKESYKIIIVDNCSTDNSLEGLDEGKDLKIIKNKTNEGFVNGNNIGMKFALNENPSLKYLVLLNNDTLVTLGWLKNMIRCAKSNKRYGVVGAKQFTFDKKPAISAGNMTFFGVKYIWNKKITEVDWVSGACFLIKKEVVEKIGYLNMLYQPIYYEETDFELRTRKAGFKVVYCPKSIFYHKGGSDTSINPAKFSLIFYRNRFIFFYRNKPLYLFSRIPVDIFRALKNKSLKLLISAYIQGIKRIYEFKNV